jgi:hypothetical protein
MDCEPQKLPMVNWPVGSDRLDANPSDLSNMPLGIRSRQVRMGWPKMRSDTPAS